MASGYLYTSLEPTLDGKPQVVWSEKELDYLEGLARWVRTEGPKPAEPEKPKAEQGGDNGAPEKPGASALKPEWEAYARHLELDVDGLTVKEIQALVEAKEAEIAAEGKGKD